jgi:hypothetical protein
MLSHKYNSVHKRKTPSHNRKFTEATATRWLEFRVFQGVGSKYLGWKFPEYEILEDDTEKLVVLPGPRSWRTPPTEERYKWNPMLEHLKGCFRGLVSDGSSHVPFVAVDLDRHSGEILAETHIREVMATGRLLQSRFTSCLGYHLKWCVEVNPRNGSVKFFGWGQQPIPIEIARNIGEQIHEALRRNGLLGAPKRQWSFCAPKFGREVFPYNHSQVLLPMRKDKTTIIDTGVLPRCLRKKRGYYGMVDYETYSVLTFCRWLRSGGQFCERTLEEELRQACANLPDEQPVPDKLKNEVQVESTKTETAPKNTGDKHAWHYDGKGADNPNSFERQHEALLVFCRRMKRVVSVEEALRYIKDNRLYTGQWEDKRARRRSRVKWILKRIAVTFDVSKCQGVRNDAPIGKYDNWARHHVGTIKGYDRRDVDEYGNVVVRRNRYQVDWRFVSTFLSVVEFALVSSPNEDGSLPQVRAEDLWNRCYESDLVKVPFNDKKWAICRDWLERQGVIRIVDRNWQRGKAMRWQVGEGFDRLPRWWRRKRQASVLEGVSLEELLERGRRGTQALNSYSPQGVLETAPQGQSGDLFVRPPP